MSWGRRRLYVIGLHFFCPEIVVSLGQVLQDVNFKFQMFFTYFNSQLVSLGQTLSRSQTHEDVGPSRLEAL